MFQVSLRVTKKQKPLYTQDKNTHKIQRRESKYTTTESHQFTKEDSKRGRKELQKSQKIINKMALVSPYLSIITLNVSGLNSPIKRYRVAEQIKTNKQTKQNKKPRPNYMLPTRDSLQL